MDTLRWDEDVARSEAGVSFFRNTIVRMLIVLNGLFVCVSVSVLGYFIRPTESLMIFHYNVYFGVETQGEWWQLFLFPLAGALFFLGHLLFARRFYARLERIAAYLMLFSAWLLNVGILVASASVAFINY